MNDIERLVAAIRALREAEINFVLIGGLAMRAHGADLLTSDVDFAYAVEANNLERLAAFLTKIHARILGRPAGDGLVILPKVLEKVRFLNLFTDLGEIDVMREVPGVDSFMGLWERAIPMDLGGFIVRVASLDDLITMKRAANRPKDQLHLRELLALKKLTEEQAAADTGTAAAPANPLPPGGE